MKKHLFNFVVLTAIFGLFLTASCKKDTKEEVSKNDLTTNIVGKYTNKDDYNLTIIVNKIDNSTVSITIHNGYFDYAFSNVKMNSSTSFTLNEYSVSSWCTNVDDDTNIKNSGTGTASNDNISVFVTEMSTSNSGNCDSNNKNNFSASK